MRKIAFLCVSVLVLIVNISCNDELNDELFDKYVYFTKNGWQDYNVDVTETGIVEVPFSIAVNGTSANDRDVNVLLALDSDTLVGYNFDKYKFQTDLYYSEFPAHCYTFESENVVIPSGSEYAKAKLTIDMNKIEDIYADYVLPLAIKEVSVYTIAKPKYSKLLMRLLFRNDFSGTYSGDGKVMDVTNESKELRVGNKTLYAMAAKKCYFFAGHKDRNSVDRADYVVTATVNPTGDVTLEATNPALNFTQERAEIEWTRKPHTTDPRFEIVTTELNVQYTFKDLTSEDNTIMRYKGSMVVSRNIQIRE